MLYIPSLDTNDLTITHARFVSKIGLMLAHKLGFGAAVSMIRNARNNALDALWTTANIITDDARQARMFFTQNAADLEWMADWAIRRLERGE